MSAIPGQFGSTPIDPTIKSKRQKSSHSIAQAYAMQKVLVNIVLNDDAKPLERASCARAWCELEERKRIIRGKPLPGQLQPDGKHKVKKSRRTIGIITPESVADAMKIA